MKAPVLESVFLNPSVLPESNLLHRVLVMGGDKTASELVRRLENEGFEVIALGHRDDTDGGTGVQLPADAVLEEVRGFVGRFEAIVASSTGRSTESAGFIVAVPAAVAVPKYNDYGLNPSDRVTTLSALEAILDDGADLVKPRGDLFHVVFLCGLEGGSDPLTFARVFDAIARLTKICRVQPYVFARDVKVAAQGLERQYRHTRNDGVLFFKFDQDGPGFENGTDGLAVVFRDPVLGVEMELLPDLVVVDENLRPPSSLKPLLEAIPSSAVMAPFLQPESIRFSGVATPKAGILAVGPSRGNFDPLTTECDLDAVMVALKTASSENGLVGLPGAPLVDQGKCTICLTCIRLCPHGAMSFRKRAEADAASCKRCGICAAECPMGAITLEPPAGQTGLADRIPAALAVAGPDDRIVAFLCRRSAEKAFESATLQIREDLTPIIVPCAGTIAQDHILSAFRNGADGVLVAGCHTGNCASIYGTVLAAERVSATKVLLDHAGIGALRLMFTTLASNTPGDLSRAVQTLKQILRHSTTREFGQG